MQKEEKYTYLKEPKEVRKLVIKVFIREIALIYGFIIFCWFLLACAVSVDSGIGLLTFCRIVMPAMFAPIGLCILTIIGWWFFRKNSLTNWAHEKVFESKKKSEE